MSLRKKKDQKNDERGLPHRKSMAGPTLLGSVTQPGAIKKSIVADMVGKQAVTTFTEPETVALHYVPPKDYTALEGRIKLNSVIDVNKEILCCKYNEEFDFLAAGCSDGSISLYQADTSEFVLTLTDDDLLGSTAPVTAIQHRPVSKSYPINANGYVKCWNYNFKQCLYTIKESRECFGITYHPRYPKYVTYGDDSKIYLYDEESKTQERILSSSNNPKIHDGHTSRVFAACFHPRSNYELLTGGWDDVVHFWDLRQPHAVRHIYGVHMCGEGIDINYKGTEVLTCSFQAENAFQIFDYGSGNLIGTLSRDEESSKLYVGKYVGKDFAVCGGTQANLFRVIDLSSNLSVASVIGLPAAVYSLDLGAPKKGNVARLDIGGLPQMAFLSGRKLYQVEFN
ncbi:transcription initiation factor TFIID subunit 5-like [Asbolus verrucosus]|uniref:Transcription initiation factor TFIID subunit 5-like n=1 Tax=Asbolus verrucosus TaxID=1661398 RepID=A0A482VDL9_ASBVE|nr:transcription initiation factor TFIID subunit 5-like [Asbolus verrucosus]